MTNPFEDDLTPQEERIVDKTLAHLKKTINERFDKIVAVVQAETKREITKDEFSRQVCRIYLGIFRAAKEKGRTLTWRQIHQVIGKKQEG